MGSRVRVVYATSDSTIKELSGLKQWSGQRGTGQPMALAVGLVPCQQDRLIYLQVEPCLPPHRVLWRVRKQLGAVDL